MNLRFYLNLTLVFFSVSLIGQAGNFRIFGTVYNTDKKTVADWTVAFLGDPTTPGIKVQTDQNGNYEQSFPVTSNARVVYQIIVTDPCQNAPLIQKAESKVGEERHDFVICAKSNPPLNPCDGRFDFAIHPDGTVEFHASPEIKDAKYYWDFGDGQTAEGKDTKHLYPNDGIYVVVLTIGTTTCKSQFTVKIEIKKIVNPPTPPVSFDNGCCGKVHIGSIISTTASTPYLFIFNAGGDFKMNEVNWDFGDGTTGTGIDVKHAYLSTGKYLVVTTIKGANCTVIINTWIHVNDVVNPPPPNPCNIDFIFSTGMLSAKFQADFKGATPDKISWDFGDGNSSSDATTSHTYAKPGDYKVTLYASINGIVCQITKVIKVGSRLVMPPNASIVIYDVSPNPATDAVTVSIKSSIKARVTLIVGDITNVSLIKQEIDLEPGDNQVPLNLSNLRSGVYIVNLYFDNKLVSSAKFQKI